jgi:hypothetical protein
MGDEWIALTMAVAGGRVAGMTTEQDADDAE